MENNVPMHQIEVTTSEESDRIAASDGLDGSDIPPSVPILLRSLIERYNISREHYISIYDEYKALQTPESDMSRQLKVEAMVQGEEDEEDQEMVEGEVGKMQNLVQSALQSYESSSAAVDLGSKRKSFSLEDELKLQPSNFAQELLQRDQVLVAQAIRKYMNQYSIPQREVVEKTNLNQSHLSQHFTHGVTMKASKRIKLYHWFEDDQKQRTGKLLTAETSLNSVLDSPKVEGSRRRPRWKWSPISTQILTEAFKKNHFPTREQRVELARVCNEAEIAMNNGSPIRGPEGDTEGITEQRVNTWFTNRRKGLQMPSPNMSDQEGASFLLTPSPRSGEYSNNNAWSPHQMRALTPNTATVLLPALQQGHSTIIGQLQMQSSGQSGSADALIHLTPSSLPLAIVQAAAAAAAAASSASSPSTQNVTTTALSLNLADGTIKLSEGLAQLSPSVLAAFIAQYQGQTQTGRSVPAAGFILPTVPTTVMSPSSGANIVVSHQQPISAAPASANQHHTTSSSSHLPTTLIGTASQDSIRFTPASLPLTISLPTGGSSITNEELARAIASAMVSSPSS